MHLTVAHDLNLFHRSQPCLCTTPSCSLALLLAHGTLQMCDVQGWPEPHIYGAYTVFFANIIQICSNVRRIYVYIRSWPTLLIYPTSTSCSLVQFGRLLFVCAFLPPVSVHHVKLGLGTTPCSENLLLLAAAAWQCCVDKHTTITSLM